jgi:hypothetical protein
MKKPQKIVLRHLIAILAVAASAGMGLAPAVALPEGTFSGDSSGLALALEAPFLDPEAPEGFTAGISAAEANSTLFAHARGAGTCEAFAPEDSSFDIPCTETNTEEAEVTGAGGEENPEPHPKCDSPEFPPELAAVINAEVACGNAEARTTGGEVFALGSGEVGRFDITLPDEIPDLLEIVAFAVGLGPTHATVFSAGNLVEASSGADGGSIGIFATDLQNPDPLVNGLIIIDIGNSSAQTTCDGSAFAAAEADPAPVTIRFKESVEDEEYTEVALPAGDTETILNDTPLETTIVAADATTTVNNEPGKGSATALASAVDIHAVKGLTVDGLTEDLDGGLRVRLSQNDAEIQCALPPSPPLAPTGGRSLMIGVGLLLAATALTLILRPHLLHF